MIRHRQGGLDVVEGIVHIVVRGKLHHGSDDGTDTPEDFHAVAFYPGAGIDAGIVHNHRRNDLRLPIACGRAGLHQIVFPGLEDMPRRGEDAAALQAVDSGIIGGREGIVRHDAVGNGDGTVLGD